MFRSCHCYRYEVRYLVGNCRDPIKSEYYINFYREELRNIPDSLAVVQAEKQNGHLPNTSLQGYS